MAFKILVTHSKAADLLSDFITAVNYTSKIHIYVHNKSVLRTSVLWKISFLHVGISEFHVCVTCVIFEQDLQQQQAISDGQYVISYCLCIHTRAKCWQMKSLNTACSIICMNLIFCSSSIVIIIVYCDALHYDALSHCKQTLSIATGDMYYLAIKQIVASGYVLCVTEWSF